jgi:acetyl-CoA C-acetyltransferase
MQGIDPRTPVMVGIGIVDQKEKDPARAREAVQLMIDAVRAAAEDCGAPRLVTGAARIYVPQGLWGYSDPARIIARALGAGAATTVYAKVGVLQQTLIGDACARIAAGEIETAIVAGGEARFRALQAQIAGTDAAETPFTEPPDEVLTPREELQLPVEVGSGLGLMPVGYYAVVESAFRAAQGLGVAEHRDYLAAMYSRFSEIAVDNPHAWKRERVSAAEIRDASARNRMLAFPYTRLHNSSWNVDQAAALLFCSAARAQALGIPRSRWVFPRASTESNHMLAMSERPDLHRLPGARIAGRRALEASGLSAAALDFVELYSCFPIAVELYAAELGIPADRDWTVTGGMPFAGGPLNNYVLQATARMAELLRDKPGSSGLLSSVSGYLTKQGFGVWATEPGPGGFVHADVTEEVAAGMPARRVVTPPEGPARICGYTVMYHDERRVCGVAVLDLADGARTVANTLDQALMDRLESEEFCGREVRLAGGQFSLG